MPIGVPAATSDPEVPPELAAACSDADLDEERVQIHGISGRSVGAWQLLAAEVPVHSEETCVGLGIRSGEARWLPNLEGTKRLVEEQPASQCAVASPAASAQRRCCSGPGSSAAIHGRMVASLPTIAFPKRLDPWSTGLHGMDRVASTARSGARPKLGATRCTPRTAGPSLLVQLAGAASPCNGGVGDRGLESLRKVQDWRPFSAPAASSSAQSLSSS